MADISAIEIKKLWYGDELTTAPTKSGMATLVESMTEVTNIHQDTWNIEESEPSQDSYRNQLTGKVYRMSRITEGELAINFTIGKYDFATKAALMGGSTIEGTGSTVEGWRRGTATNIYKCFVALTDDNVYVVIPRASIVTREANTDKAIGLAVKATMMEPTTANISSEYWFA